MAESKSERFDADLRWNAIPEKRRKELFVLLSMFHFDDLRAGRASAQVAVEMFRKSHRESQRRYDAAPTEWSAWVAEQSAAAFDIDQAKTYSRACEELGDAVRPGIHLSLATGATPYLKSIEGHVAVPAYPECYRPHMNWAAADWMLLHEVPGAIFPHPASFPRINELPRKPELLRKKKKAPTPQEPPIPQLEELRYCVLMLAHALTDPLNIPDRERYRLDRVIQGKENQIPKPLREDIASMFRISPSTVARWLKAMGFQLPPDLRFAKRTASRGTGLRIEPPTKPLESRLSN